MPLLVREAHTACVANDGDDLEWFERCAVGVTEDGADVLLLVVDEDGGESRAIRLSVGDARRLSAVLMSAACRRAVLVPGRGVPAMVVYA